MKSKWFAILGILSMLLSLVPGSVLGATPALAQAGASSPDQPADVQKVYLPMVVSFGRPAQPPVASGYAAALSQALAACAGTTLNQVCYGRGSVTLTGGGTLTTPGQKASLAGVTGLTLVSPDANHWSIALLRLAADAVTPDLGLTVLAFGNVEIRNLALFTTAAGNGGAAPALTFRSSPVPGQDPETGGLIVYNPTHEDTLSIHMNGAEVTLASSAVVQAQPGAQMSVTMAAGSALVSTTAGSTSVTQAYQVSVPLDGNGAAAGAPTQPELTDEDLLEPLVPDPGAELLEPLVPPKPERDPVKIAANLLAEFESAQSRCLQGNSRQVYRVMWSARMLEQYKAYIPFDRYSLIDTEVSNCATFEVDFNSVITVTGQLAWGNMYVKGQGMTIKFGSDGRLIQPGQMPLTHVRYDVDFALYCNYIILEDGRMPLWDGSMRINQNRLDISTQFNVAGVFEHFFYNCDQTIEMANPASWDVLFREMHVSEENFPGYLFTPEHWKYTGNTILAEAIFSRSKEVDPVTAITGDTWLTMLHKPSI